MKKFLLLILSIIIILFIFNVILPMFKKYHNISYHINNKYSIKEIYKKENKNNNYYFTVKSKNNTYSFMYTNDNNKKEIIKDIKLYNSSNLKCILPIFDNNKISDIYCLSHNKQISSSYLKANKDFQKVYIKLKKDNYKLKTINDSDNNIIKDYISIYKNNLNSYKYVVWFYKGIYIIDKDNILKKKLLKNDNYYNKLSALVNNYYVTVNTDLDKNSIEYKEILLYNLDNNKDYKIKLKDNLSINTYINGVYKDSLYLTDNDIKVQYKLNPKTKKIEKIGDTNKGFKLLENNKLITVRKNINNIFDYRISNSKIKKLYKPVYIIKSNSSYYFKTKDGSMYQVINNNYDNPILLFKSKDIEEMKIKDNYISFVSDNTIYNYSNEYGLRPIIINNELRYNSKNIYDVIKK